MTMDPVCSSEVDEVVAHTHGLSVEYNGRIYLFCSDECRQRFDRDPTAYAPSLPGWEDTELGYRSWPVE